MVARFSVRKNYIHFIYLKIAINKSGFKRGKGFLARFTEKSNLLDSISSNFKNFIIDCLINKSSDINFFEFLKDKNLFSDYMTHMIL